MRRDPTVNDHVLDCKCDSLVNHSRSHLVDRFAVDALYVEHNGLLQFILVNCLTHP